MCIWCVRVPTRSDRTQRHAHVSLTLHLPLLCSLLYLSVLLLNRCVKDTHHTAVCLWQVRGLSCRSRPSHAHGSDQLRKWVGATHTHTRTPRVPLSVRSSHRLFFTSVHAARYELGRLTGCCCVRVTEQARHLRLPAVAHTTASCARASDSHETEPCVFCGRSRCLQTSGKPTQTRCHVAVGVAASLRDLSAMMSDHHSRRESFSR